MSTLRQHVQNAAARADVRDAVARVYAHLQREIDARKPLCTASGRCCRFEEFGHRLYVTTIELAAFVSQLPEPPTQGNPGGCPFQVGGLCSVHTIRPFGCRVFFCDSSSEQWQHQQYERFHGELKRLHEELAVSYHYVEWRDALRQLDFAPPRLVAQRFPLAVSRTPHAPIRETASGHPAESGNRSASGPNRLSLPQLPL